MRANGVSESHVLSFHPCLKLDSTSKDMPEHLRKANTHTHTQSRAGHLSLFLTVLGQVCFLGRVEYLMPMTPAAQPTQRGAPAPGAAGARRGGAGSGVRCMALPRASLGPGGEAIHKLLLTQLFAIHLSAASYK